MTHEHLNDEQLSDHLDGEILGRPSSATTPDGTVAAGIAGCVACRDRLAALTAARALVRRPVVPVAPSVRAAAVEAALTAGLDAGDLGSADGGAGGAGARSVSTLDPRVKRPARPTGVLVGAAAAVAILVVAVGVSLGLSHSSPSSTASSALDHAPARAAVPESTTTPPGGVPDLGPVTSTNLRSRLTPLLGPGKQVSGTTRTSFAAGTPSDDNATSASPAATGASLAAPSACVSAARQAAGTAGPPELLATATYRHTPAFVFVVPVGGATAAPGDEAVVVAQSGCRVLAHTTL